MKIFRAQKGAKMPDLVLSRLRSVDWSNKPEAKICSELITPVLVLLGYGEHTLHNVAEQQTYTLKDPTMMKGHRQVRLDYEPRVYETGLWVMEAKGTNKQVTKAALGQARDYAIHPEVRAALVVTVDRAGFRVFDPWDEHWEEPLLTVPPNEVADRIEELRAVLGVDRVGDFVRKRHLDHLRRALSASLEFGVLQDAEKEFRELIDDARKAIDERRLEVYRKSMADYEDLHDRVLRQSGSWGVMQAQNTPWPGSMTHAYDLSRAVLAQDEVQRPTQLLRVWPAIDAVYEKAVPAKSNPRRPLWWIHIAVLASSLRLRGEPGCEPYAEEMARRALRDTLLGFPDDPVAAAFWDLQRALIPLTARIVANAPLEKLSEQASAHLSAEDRIRYKVDPARVLIRNVKLIVLEKVQEIEPWTAAQLQAEAGAAKKLLAERPIPEKDWPGPIGDPWLMTWQKTDPLRVTALAILAKDASGDDLLDGEDVRESITEAAASEYEYESRWAKPVQERLE